MATETQTTAPNYCHLAKPLEQVIGCTLPFRVRVLSDKRPGHENQSIGLAHAIQKRLSKRMAASVDVIQFEPRMSLPKRIRTACAAGLGQPGIIIAAGHSTHLPLWLAAKKFKVPSILVMKPSLPTWLFSMSLVPIHDLPPSRIQNERGVGPHTRIIPIFGALNRLPERTAKEIAAIKEPYGLILLGGPSKHHSWDASALTSSITTILATRPELRWVIGDSRRTPADTLNQLRTAGLQAEFILHKQTTPDWLPEQLAHATEAWVTEDSVSMIHEAVTSGARTGVLPAPRRRANDRVARSIDLLLAAGYATRFQDWQANGRHLSAPLEPLHETGRCAEIIISRFLQTPAMLAPSR